MTKLIATLLIGLTAAAGTFTHTRRPKLPAPQPRHAPMPVPRILCERPRTLALRRFEDRSAQLLCRGRILVRIAVPG